MSNHNDFSSCVSVCDKFTPMSNKQYIKAERFFFVCVCVSQVHNNVKQTIDERTKLTSYICPEPKTTTA
jgi:hypothetical protein